MNTILLATLALAAQANAPRFAAPAVDEDFRTRLAPPGDRWLATAPNGATHHCGALYVEGIAVDLFASPVEGPQLDDHARQIVADAIDWYEDASIASLEEVEFEGCRAFDIVTPSLSPDEAFGFMMLEEDQREGIDLPFAATRVVDRQGIRYSFITDAVGDAGSAVALLRDACDGWTFLEGDVAPRTDEGEELAAGPAWAITGRTLDDAISRSRFQLPAEEDWEYPAEPPWEPSSGAVLASLTPFPLDLSVPTGTVYVRRGLAPGVLEDGARAWPERADCIVDPALEAALRESFPDAPAVAAFVSEEEELFGEVYPAMWIARVVVDAGDGAWTFVDAEVIDVDGFDVDPAEWTVAWIEAILDGRGALPDARRRALLESARTRALDVGNRRWDGSVLRDGEVGVTWTAPDGLWAPEDPALWAVPGEDRRFDATCLDGGIRVELDVARDITRDFGRAVRRGVRRSLGSSVDASDLPDPVPMDAPEGVEMARIELPDGFGDGRAGVVVVARVDRQVYSMAASCAADAYADRAGLLRDACAALAIDPAVAGRSVWVDDAAFVDLEIGYAFDAPGGGWDLVEDATFLEDKTGFSACAWKDHAANAWLGISANDIHGMGVDGDAYDALSLSSAMASFEGAIERSTVGVAGMTADIVSGTKGDGDPVTIATFRRGTMAFSMTMTGRTEQFGALAALRRFRLID